jgi:hypothetical protein
MSVFCWICILYTLSFLSGHTFHTSLSSLYVMVLRRRSAPCFSLRRILTPNYKRGSRFEPQPNCLDLCTSLLGAPFWKTRWPQYLTREPLIYSQNIALARLYNFLVLWSCTFDLFCDGRIRLGFNSQPATQPKEALTTISRDRLSLLVLSSIQYCCIQPR